MKSFAKFLTGLAIIAALLVGYYILSSSLPAEMDVSVTEASAMQTEFQALEELVANGHYEGITSLDDISRYSFVTITIEARNFSPFPAEWTQYTPKGIEGDMLVYMQDAGPKDIRPFQTDDFYVTILTENPTAERSGWLEYYIFGRFHSLLIEPKKA
ncbi:MAG: hypothetical protein IJC48_02010 [Clostridia bacterium]|nr:hypothetical protein [Clostridia bacterium]